MLTKLTLAAGVMMIAATLAGGASAAPAMPQTSLIGATAKADALVQQVSARHHRRAHRHSHQRHRVQRHHRRHHHLGHRILNTCSVLRSRCAASYGWGTRGFRYCVRRNGC